MFSFNVPQVCPSLDQKEQNCFRHPQFYSSIAPMIFQIIYQQFLFLGDLLYEINVGLCVRNAFDLSLPWKTKSMIKYNTAKSSYNFQRTH